MIIKNVSYRYKFDVKHVCNKHLLYYSKLSEIVQTMTRVTTVLQNTKLHAPFRLVPRVLILNKLEK